MRRGFSWYWVLPVSFAFLFAACGGGGGDELPACADGLDNDGDGFVDLADPACENSQDNDEGNEPQCADGVDNDEDGLVDLDDPGCDSPQDNDEVQTACSDGIDNDGDGFVDLDDSGCDDPTDDDEFSSQCSDGIDNDGDGLIDTGDPGCDTPQDDDEFDNAGLTACNDGIDSDGDILVDLADPGCDGPDDIDEGDSVQCDDGVDNDFDGLSDGDDPQCILLGQEADPTNLPDIIMLDDPNLVDVFIQDIPDVDASDSEFLDGCFTGLGNRKVIRWDSFVGNAGDRNLVVGDKFTHGPIWTNNPHFGFVFEGFSQAFIIDQNGNKLSRGHKASFCMIDLHEFDSNTEVPQGNFNCGPNQGISVGHADIYSAGFSCQFVDITDIAPGNYTLRVESNFKNELPEKDYSNNAINVPVTIP